MRTRAILLVLAVLAVAAFAALNWGEFLRSSPLLFGPVVMDAPLGLIMLTILALATIAFVLTSAAIRTGSLIESRQHFKTLEAQRALADTAEASRFTELRSHLDTQLREPRPRFSPERDRAADGPSPGRRCRQHGARGAPRSDGPGRRRRRGQRTGAG